MQMHSATIGFDGELKRPSKPTLADAALRQCIEVVIVLDTLLFVL